MTDDDPMGVLLRAVRDARAVGFPLTDRDLAEEIENLVDERQAMAMRLYWLEGVRPQVAVARQMGIAQKNVSKLLAKGSRSVAARIANLAAEWKKQAPKRV